MDDFELEFFSGDEVTSDVNQVATVPVVDVLGYDRYIVGFSGGKDSLACVLHLIEAGVDRSKIELHHHLLDGREGSTLFDWPITESYCEAVAKGLKVTLTFSHRVGGLEAEMLRRDSATAAVCIPSDDGYKTIGGNGPPGTRLKFPQVSSSLTVRWCSAVGKIDVFARYLTNHPKFRIGKTLVITGERAQESKSRASYKVFEPHRCDLRSGREYQRHIDHWRPVHQWDEREVWDIIKRFSVNPHPSYVLGFARASCRACVFSSKDQWATVREIAPEQFEQIARYEAQFGVTIHRTESVIQRANKGTPYKTDPFWVEIANSRTYNVPIFVDQWELPQGAYGDSCGPA